MLIIFDCDGVLIDSEIIAAMALSEALVEDDVHIQAAELARRFVGISDKETFATLRVEYPGLSSQCGERYQELSRVKFDAELVAIDGIHDVLASIKSAGFKCCVASSSSPERLQRTLGKVSLLPYFDGHIYSSAQVQRGKPAPDLFLFAASQCGITPDRCLVVEDSPAGVIAAVDAGMAVVGFCGASHCGPAHASQLQGLGAKHVLHQWNSRGFLGWLGSQALNRP